MLRGYVDKLLLFILLIIFVGVVLGGQSTKEETAQERCVKIHKEARYCKAIIEVGLFK